MDSLIDDCLAKKIPLLDDGNSYSIVHINSIGEVVARNDGYYGVAICNIPTPEDTNPYYTNHVKYMTFVPFILYLMQADSSTLDIPEYCYRLFKELHIEFNFDPGAWYNDNIQYLSNMTMIWVHESNDCCNQVTEPVSTNTVVFRNTYNYFINCAIQSTNPDMFCC